MVEALPTALSHPPRWYLLSCAATLALVGTDCAQGAAGVFASRVDGSISDAAGIDPTVSTLSFFPPAGSYGFAQSVAISTANIGATICYTTNGTDPAAASPGMCSTGSTYTVPVSVASSETLKAIATRSGYPNSSIASAAYTITSTVAPTPVSIVLNGNSYALKEHPRVMFDGHNGAFAAGNAYNGGPPAKATSSNPAWQGVLSANSSATANGPLQDGAGNPIPSKIASTYVGGNNAASWAMQWYSDNTQTTALTNAIYLLDHIESYYYMYCDDQGGANCNFAYSPSSYGMVYYMDNWIFAYELIQSQMTSTERQAFADKMLNDVAAYGGVSGSPSVSCVNPSVVGGINASGVAQGGDKSDVITATTPVFGAGYPVQTGYWVSQPAGIAQVVGIKDSTHATISTSNTGSWTGYAGPIGYRRTTWQAGDCGILWLSKHERYSPQSLTYVGGSSQYPVDASFSPGGVDAGWDSNNTMAAAHGFMDVFLSLVDIDVNASQRSQSQITALYDDWYTNGLQAIYSRDFTGFHHTGGLNYGWDRPEHNAMMSVILQDSLVSPPPLGGIWDQNLLYLVTMNLLPSAQIGQKSWGQDVNFGQLDANSLYDYMPLYFTYRNSDLGRWFNWTLQHRITKNSNFGNVPGTNLFWVTSGSNLTGNGSANAFWFYAFTDPTYPSTDMTTTDVPTGASLNRVDATSGTTYPQSVLISRTGYSKVDDTLLNLYGMGEEFIDHNAPCDGATCWYPGDYRIFKGNYLLAPDGGTAFGGKSTAWGSYWDNEGGAKSGYIEIGGTYNLRPVLNAKMPLAVADGGNRFAYAMVDSTASYTAATQVSRVHRHLIDFKKVGTQQFIVVYDNVATSKGETIRTYLHYPNNRGASSDSSKGSTSLAGTAVASSYPGTGSGDATQLLTQVLAPAGNNSVSVYTCPSASPPPR